MTIEQQNAPLAIRPAQETGVFYARAPEKWIPSRILRCIEQWAGLGSISNLPVIEYASLSGPVNFTPLARAGKKSKIIMIRISNPTQVRFIEQSLLMLNECLPVNGCLLGCLDKGAHKGRRRQPEPLPAALPASSDGLFRKALLPLYAFAEKAYRWLEGPNHAFPDMRTCGRLMAYGFSLLEVFETPEERYFVARKARNQKTEPRAGRGPLIRLKRVGKGGRWIDVYKFRTMYPYAEHLQEYIYEHYGLQDGGKMKEDPRVTPLGRFLRKYWLDELPMLFNLLRGDLKLFGVRPISEQYLSLYPEEYRQYRNRFKPGLIPPFYADLPKTLEEIMESEKQYLKAYEQRPWLTDWRYFRKACYNIFCRGVRSC